MEKQVRGCLNPTRMKQPKTVTRDSVGHLGAFLGCPELYPAAT